VLLIAFFEDGVGSLLHGIAVLRLNVVVEEHS
jgi:hypothetical protein